MNEHTDLFLAGLSHRWSGYVVAATVLSGMAVAVAGTVQARCRAAGGTRGFRLARAVRAVFLSFFVLSVPVLVISVLHLGCAGIEGHQMQCLSNVKQLGTAMFAYAQDYDEHFPPAARWAEAIAPDIAKSQAGPSSGAPEPADVFLCPAADTPASYGMNAAVGSAATSDVAAPELTAVLFDADAPSRSFSGGECDVAWDRHLGSPYIGFMDGHAKSVRRGIGDGAVVWTTAAPNESRPQPPVKPHTPVAGLRR